MTATALIVGVADAGEERNAQGACNDEARRQMRIDVGELAKQPTGH